jgi:hypothetical protein
MWHFFVPFQGFVSTDPSSLFKNGSGSGYMGNNEKLIKMDPAQAVGEIMKNRMILL